MIRKKAMALLCLAALSFCFSSRADEYRVEPAAGARPEKSKTVQTVYSGAAVEKDFSRSTLLRAPAPEEYVYADNGVFTFRGDNWRRNAAYGNAPIAEGKMEILWKYPLGSLSTKDSGKLYGVGWGSQPAIVKWPYEIRRMMCLKEEAKNVPGLKEVIFTAQDGKVYFLDLLNGTPTRDEIRVGYPLRGSVTVDPASRPMIGFGQSVSKLSNGKTGPIGYYVYELINGEQLFFLNGRASDEQKQYSTNGAFDGTGLFLSQSMGDALVLGGENGLLYTIDLNTQFDYLTDTSLTVSRRIHYLRVKDGGEKETRTTMESSPAMAGKYVFTADGWGILRCVDTDSMQVMWSFDSGDNTDAAVALDREQDGGLSLYTGNTVFDRLKKKKTATIRKLNALTGEEEWHYDVPCVYNKSELSGCKASPVIGENSVADLVFFTVNMTEKGKTSALLALDKASGELRWQMNMDSTAVSSPVAVYNEQGNAWIIQADESGLVHLLDAAVGVEIASLQLEGAVTASPAVYEDILVLGTGSKAGAYMYGIRLR